MNDLITRFLAELLEKFKLKSPKVYGIVIAALLATIAFAQQGTAFGLFSLPPVLADVVQWVATVLAALLSTQTFNFLSAESQAKRSGALPPPPAPPKPGLMVDR